MINWFCFLCPQCYSGNHFHVNEITNFTNYTILNYCEVLFIKCSPWGHKESYTTEQLNWTDLHKRLILEGTVAGDIFQLKLTVGSSHLAGKRWKTHRLPDWIRTLSGMSLQCPKVSRYMPFTSFSKRSWTFIFVLTWNMRGLRPGSLWEGRVKDGGREFQSFLHFHLFLEWGSPCLHKILKITLLQPFPHVSKDVTQDWRTGMAFLKSCIQPAASRYYYDTTTAQGTVRKEKIDSEYGILSNQETVTLESTL